MRTQRTILLIVLAVAIGCASMAGLLIAAFGWRLGLTAVAALAALVVGAYVDVLGPWHRRWGATDAEVEAPLPGDELLPGANATTRAITIDAAAAAVWPWLIQLGFGRAGWYSYDWIDNDGQPSADLLVLDLQHLDVGDVIAMTPTMGYLVTAVDPGRTITARADDGSSTWCLALEPIDATRCRLVSRFRAAFEVTPASIV